MFKKFLQINKKQYNRKRAKILNRYITKDPNQITSKNMKRWEISLVMKKMKIKNRTCIQNPAILPLGIFIQRD